MNKLMYELNVCQFNCGVGPGFSCVQRALTCKSCVLRIMDSWYSNVGSLNHLRLNVCIGSASVPTCIFGIAPVPPADALVTSTATLSIRLPRIYCQAPVVAVPKPPTGIVNEVVSVLASVVDYQH